MYFCLYVCVWKWSNQHAPKVDLTQFPQTNSKPGWVGPILCFFFCLTPTLFDARPNVSFSFGLIVLRPWMYWNVEAYSIISPRFCANPPSFHLWVCVSLLFYSSVSVSKITACFAVYMSNYLSLNQISCPRPGSRRNSFSIRTVLSLDQFQEGFQSCCFLFGHILSASTCLIFSLCSG